MKGFITALCTILLLAWHQESLRAQENNIPQILESFNEADAYHKGESANLFMGQLLKEGFLDEDVKFSQNTHPDTINCHVWYWAAEWFYSQGGFKQAYDYASLALPICEGTSMEADCLNILSLACFRLSNFEQAAEYAKRCYKLDAETEDPDIMSSSLNTIAGIYLGANQLEEAKEYILKAIQLSQQTDNQVRKSVIYGMASEIYHAQGNDTEALKYINEAYKIEKEFGRKEHMMVRLAQKSSVLLGLHEYSAAEEILQELIPFFRKIGDIHSLGISYNKMGMSLLAQERVDEAITYYEEAAAIFLEMGDMRNEMHSRKGLYESLWNKNTDSAKVELERFNDLKDSLYNNFTAEKLARFNAEFGTDWLKNENELQKVKIKRIMYYSAILLVSVAFAIWFFMKKRIKMHDLALHMVIEELRNNTVNKAENSIETELPNPTDETLSQADRYFLEKLVEIITKGMTNGNISVEHLADKMYITRGQLNRRVKQVTGVTTQQYISRVRMEYAKLLLTNSPGLSISEVSYMCGFDDATSFSRAFKRTFDISPLQCKNGAME